MTATANLAALSTHDLLHCRGGLSGPALMHAYGAAENSLGKITQYHQTRTTMANSLGVAGPAEAEYVADAQRMIAKRTAQSKLFFDAGMHKLTGFQVK